MNKLSIIITFLNEKEEVERTIKSIKKHSFIDLPIILINDASDDNYDYDILSHKYSIEYVKNSQRLGVAKCRDIGVDRCKTPYFLLLDAHMRFYDTKWYDKMISILSNNDKVLLCCQTKNIRKENKTISKPVGAKIYFWGMNNTFETVWNYQEKYPSSVVEEIPCVLGAAYAMSKNYWIYLKGLTGLLSYGGDEAYISIKVWLEGGKCILLKDVIVGHLYRKKYPYNFNDSHVLYNKLLIAELIFPRKVKSQIFSKLKWDYKAYQSIFLNSYKMILENKKNNYVLRQYYSSIFRNTFDYYQQFNSTYFPEANAENITNVDVDQIAIMLMFNLNNSNIGLNTGLMGSVLFFQCYSKYKGDFLYDTLASELLDKIFNHISPDSPIGFENGLCGIGWGIEYLIQNNLMEGNSDEILAEIDQKIMECNFLKITDYSMSTGIAGFLHYIYIRMNQARSSIKYPFDVDFLTTVKEVVSNLIFNPNFFEGVDVAIGLLDILEGYDKTYSPPEINDIIHFNNYIMRGNSELSLSGLIGKSINLMKRNEK